MTSHPFWANGEVRVLNDGAIDEIVAGQIQAFHLEQLDDDHWWLGIYGKDDRRMSIRFYRKGKRIIVTAEDDGDHSSGITLGFDQP